VGEVFTESHPVRLEDLGRGAIDHEQVHEGYEGPHIGGELSYVVEMVAAEWEDVAERELRC